MPTRTIAGSRGIVTGASSGIGRAIAIELARNGASVLAVARRGDRLADLATSWHAPATQAQYGGSMEILAGDICNPTIRLASVVECKEAFGGMDFLVNAAGISSVARFAESTPERLREIMEVNFFAPAELIRSAIPALRTGTNPVIVNIGSILGHRGIPWHADYCASKFALQGFAESVRPELAKLGIDLLMVNPGTTKTELYNQDEARQRLPWRQPAGVSAEYVAQKTVKAMSAGRNWVIPNRRGRLLVHVSRWFPRLVDRLMAKYG